MRSTLLLLLLISMTVTGCARVADSRLNPLNWFGRSQAVQNTDAEGNLRPLVMPGELVTIVDSRPLVGSVSSLSIDRTPDGAIVRATGQTSGQGFYNAELVAIEADGGTLTLAFRASAPATRQAGTQNITAAYVLTNAELANIRRVRVQAQSNALVSSR